VGGHVELVETLAMAFNPFSSHISRHARNDNARYYSLFAILTLPTFSIRYATLHTRNDNALHLFNNFQILKFPNWLPFPLSRLRSKLQRTVLFPIYYLLFTNPYLLFPIPLPFKHLNRYFLINQIGETTFVARCTHHVVINPMIVSTTWFSHQ
jgi:hypothetical protein